MDKVLITGANGFIGSHVAELFCNENYHVGCLVRKESNLDNIKDLNVEIHYGDIRNIENLSRIIKKYDAVIHIAALVKDWGRYKDFYDINVNGTLNVIKACKENNINQIIITSSCSVYGEENSYKVKDEKSPHTSHYKYLMDKIFPCKMNYYRDTKKMAKEKASIYAKENSLNVTFIEPVWVFGEREFNTGFYEYLKTVKEKVPVLPGTAKNNFHVVYVKDLTRAYLLGFKKKLKGIHSFLIGNKNTDKMDYIYKLFCKEAGYKKPGHLPKWLIYPAGFILEFLYTIFNIKNPPILTRGRINMFYDNIEYSVKKAREILGFENYYSLEEGIKRTVNWYKKNNLL